MPLMSTVANTDSIYFSRTNSPCNVHITRSHSSADGASLFSRLAVLSQFDTHPGSGGVATHPVTAQVIDYAGEHRVSPLRDCHVLQWVQEVRLQT